MAIEWRRTTRANAAGAVIALSLTAFAGCGDRSPSTTVDDGPPPVRASVSAVRTGTLAVRTEATATVAAWRRVAPGTKILGRIESVPVREGQHVAAGALLARIEDRDLRAAVDQAAAAVRMAEARHENALATERRISALHERGSATDTNLDDVRAALRVAAAGVDQARANLAAAEVMLGYAEVRSPIAGWIVDRRVEAGDMAAPGMPMFVVDDLSKVEIRVQVPEADVVGLEPGRSADVKVPAVPYATAGTIARVVPAGDPRSGTYEVRVVLDNPEGLMRSGMFARVRFDRGAREAITVPASARVTRGQLDGVFVVGDDGRARIRWVRVRPVPGDDDRLEILSGLGAGERIVETPPESLVDGGRIEEV